MDTALNDKLVAAIDGAYEHENENISYVRGKAIGAGSLGDKCLRRLFYKFRWFRRNIKIEGRILRLFDRGHREEPALWAHLEKIGATIYEFEDPEKEKQYRMKFASGHGTGFLDCIIAGISQWLLGTAVDELILGEAKTYNKSQFNDLVKKGFQAKKPEHYAQMILYMHAYGLKHGLYIAVCKDDDRLHFEYIEANTQLAEDYLARAHMIAFSDVLPHKYSDNPAFYECKFCDYHGNCHGGAMPAINCRTCAYSSTFEGGEWRCMNEAHALDVLSPEAQEMGAECQHHAYHPHYLDTSALTYEPALNTETHFAYRVGDTDMILYNGFEQTASVDLYAMAIEHRDRAG